MKRAILSLSFLACASYAAPLPQHTSALLNSEADKEEIGADAPAASAEPSAEGAENKSTDSAQGSAAGGNAAPTPENQQPAAGSQGDEETLIARLTRSLEEADNLMSQVKKPSRTLSSSMKRFKERAARDLEEIRKVASEVRDLNEKYNNTLTGSFEFTVVTAADRDKYVRDARAAYEAMLTDMKENKGKRKVGGLGKFELMRDRYQGVPEYIQAHETYLKTLMQLDKHWTKMYERETKRRERMNDQRQRALEEADDEQYEKLAEQFKREKENIETVWYNPQPRNLKMLRNCTNRVKDALRRNKDAEMDDAVGKVPEMLAAFWAKMDEAREALMRGEFDRATSLLDSDEVTRGVTRLRSNIFPQEYRDPLNEQLRELKREVSSRSINRNREKLALERKITDLDRKVRSFEARVDNMVASIEDELSRQMDEEQHDADDSNADTAAGDEQAAEGDTEAENEGDSPDGEDGESGESEESQADAQ